jgi:hypothetical protein
MTQTSPPQFFHCYATANDDKLFIEDINNIISLTQKCSGVGPTNLYIAISTAREKDHWDELFTSVITSLLSHHDNITLKEIFFKGNTGRDFSSYARMTEKVLKVSSPNDYVFFQNRSACGPFIDNWLDIFLLQYNKFDSVALCGSSINFLDHPSRSQRDDLPHIQTYAFLTTAYYLQMLDGYFPGENEIERLDIIVNGEIGLSQFFLNKGNNITCLEWPDERVTRDSISLASVDVKYNVTENHPFYHRHYMKKNKKKYPTTKMKALWVYLRECVTVLLAKGRDRR